MTPPIFLEIAHPHGTHDVDEPFLVDGWLYATNGMILVRKPDWSCSRAELERYGALDRKLPDVGKVEHCWAADRLTPIPLVQGCESYLPCPGCHPTWVSCYPLLPASGNDQCEECDGDGWFMNTLPIPHGPLFLMGRYVGMLDRHGVREVSLLDATVNGESPVYFRTREFEGLLMPMDPSRKKEVA